MNDRVSVVIVNWNGARFLPQLIESLQNESPLEIIVVDNHSSDESRELLKNKPEIQLISNPDNKGFGAAANQGFAASTGEYIFLLNVDIRVPPGSMESLRLFLETHPEAGIVAPRLVDPDGKIQKSCRSFPTPMGLFLYLSYLDKIFPNSYTHQPDAGMPMEVDQPMGAALMMRLRMLDQTGGFDERFFMYMEDVDLCYRAKQTGWKIYYLPDASVVHFGGGSSEQVWFSAQQYFYRSLFQYFEKHHPHQLPSLGRTIRFALILRSLVMLISGRLRKSIFFSKLAVSKDLR